MKQLRYKKPKVKGADSNWWEPVCLASPPHFTQTLTMGTSAPGVEGGDVRVRTVGQARPFCVFGVKS